MNQPTDPVKLPPEDVKTKRLHWFWRLVLLAIIATAAYTYFTHTKEDHNEPSNGKAEKKPENLPVVVTIATTTQDSLPVYLAGLGTVTPLHTITVRSRIDGELVRIAFKEGQDVHKNDVLAEIDARPYNIQLQQAEGQLLHDRALLKNAEIDLARYKTLLQQDSIAAQQVTTQSALVDQYRSTIQIDLAAVDNAKLQLSYTKIVAPVAGRMGLRLIDQGNIIHANDANGIVVLTQTRPITVVFTLPEDDVPQVMRKWQADHKLTVNLFDRAGKHELAVGRLIAIDNQIDPTTGTIKLKAQFENDDRSLFANQFVNVKMKLDTLDSVILAPIAAIQQGTIGPFVYLVKEDGQTVSVRPVKLGVSEGERIVITEGLEPDEKVVIDGTDKLREGSQIRIIDIHKPQSLSIDSNQPRNPS